jgi:predicted transporter
MSKIVKGILYAGAAAIVLAGPVFGGTSVPVRTPEPGTIMMVVSGIGAVAGLRYYKIRKK